VAQHRNLNLTRVALTMRVIVRFWLRIAILVTFALFGGAGFDQSLVLLLMMSTVLSAVLATIKREEPFAPVINHWDEAIAYAALCCLLIAFGHHVPG
jgi:hypothetical protein